jgi:hypothetical protein
MLMPASVDVGKVSGHFRTTENQPVETQHNDKQSEHCHGGSPFLCLRRCNGVAESNYPRKQLKINSFF